MYVSVRPLWRALGGALGGFAAWAFSEWLVRAYERASYEPTIGELFALGLIWGICIGLAIRLSDTPRLIPLRSIAVGALLSIPWCGIAGTAGVVVGQLLYEPQTHISGLLGGMGGALARSFGWGIFGSILGLGLGLMRGSIKGATNAAIGGALGGMLGGFAFEALSGAMSGALARLFSLVVVGSLIGLCIGYVETVFSRALLKVINGKLEGKEFILDKPLITVGCKESCDVAIYYDKAVQPLHATLRWVDGYYLLESQHGARTLVNGIPVLRQPVKNSDIITVGNTKLVYRIRQQLVPTHCSDSGAKRIASAHKQPQPTAVEAFKIAAPRLHRFPESMIGRRCTKCGHRNRYTAKFCGHCGHEL
ncbi:MAG: FHA domain-containing protein [Armatimonadota bacterium]|nr:zinc-ribbon domain-containing protein [Armatimonadota bacterium]MCX7777814.1 zinc-ribbon domain-containing protein [Armatimonadota bacterium]MDW8025928.1 FHA domain-containing protein [Armatimonadota bacterium]